MPSIAAQTPSYPPEGPIELSVIVPCLDEELNVPELCERVLAVFERGEIRGELILVDDGSRDGTARVIRGLSEARRSGEIEYLRPDGKSQVTIEYDGDRPVRVDAVVLSTQHSPTAPHDQIKEDLTERIIANVIPEQMMDKHTKIYVNPTGRFVTGGPHGDAGVTGRKIIVDTYGGMAPHGGGAFSGKDPTKVDRSACYMARHIAKNIVAAGLAERAMVQLAYAIGVADPVSVLVDTEGTGRISDERIVDLVRVHFKLTPRGIIESLDLRRPIYRQTAAFGHFGRTEPDFTWERTDKAPALRTEAGL